MGTKARYLLEGKWIGYRSSQDRVVHREITTNAELVEWAMNAFDISYTDGTTLQLSVRLLNKGERVKKPMRDGYGSLIRDCFRNNVRSVQQLIELRKEVN